MSASRLGQVGRLGIIGGVTAASAYVGYAGLTWLRYGHPCAAAGDARDPLLDRFMPVYDVVERHHIAIDAPAAITLDVARNFAIDTIPLARLIFLARTLMLSGEAPRDDLPSGLIDQMLALGWGVLADQAGTAIVMGAVTRPWEANPTFQAIAAGEFASACMRNSVKIAWTLRADPVGPHASVFRTETRAVASDDEARRRFRVYWALLSPGIGLIRRASLRPIKRAAEGRFKAGDAPGHPQPASSWPHVRAPEQIP